jgi:hypothetical protein
VKVWGETWIGGGEQPEVSFSSDLWQGGDVAVKILRHERCRPLYDVVH